MPCISLKSLLSSESLPLSTPPLLLAIYLLGEKQIICPVELSIVWIFWIVLSHTIVACVSYEMGVKSRDLVTLKQ